MKALIGVATACLIAASGAVYVYASVTADPAAKACEATLKERLKSPSSYRRVSIGETHRDMTIAEYTEDFDKVVSLQTIKLRTAGFLKEKPTPQIFNVHITYDAQNSYGAMLRGQSDCTYKETSKIATIN